jgi:hypothetical protein
LGPVQLAQAAEGSCYGDAQFGTGCPNIGGELGDDEALLSGDLNGPGSGNSGGAGNSGGSDGSGNFGPHLPGSPRLFEPCVDVFEGYCAGIRPDQPGDPGGVVDPITLSDIEAFRPTPPVQFMQPDGWMVVGLPTNFYAATSAHVVGGELLGLSADVRFTPITYRWRYGDGSTAVLGTRGATWQALGLREFDATATSHIYRASGTYVIDLDVDYTAEYRILGGTWLRIPGTLQLPANRLIATAGSAVTVLVDRDCASAPSGPGC